MTDAPNCAATIPARRVPILTVPAAQPSAAGGEGQPDLIAFCRGPATAGAPCLYSVEGFEQALTPSEFTYRMEKGRAVGALDKAEFAQLAAAARATSVDGVARPRQAPTRAAPQ